MAISIKLDSGVCMGNQKDSQISFNGKDYPCPVSMAMDLIGGKWKAIILFYLQEKEKRFSELKKDIPNITEMTLSLQLKQLEKDRLVIRTVYGDKPTIKVVYALSPLAKELEPFLEGLCLWALKVADA